MTTIYITDKTTLPTRAAFDLYKTEQTLIRAALATFAPAAADSVLDIAPGDGRWGLEAQRKTGAAYLAGVDVRPLPRPSGFTAWHTADFLEWPGPVETFDLVVSNPPYFQAEAIIRWAWGMLADGGTMIMLLRLAFQAGIGRERGLWLECPLSTVAVCSRRPSFYGGGSNGTDYGVFCWIKGQGTPGRWETVLLTYERDGQ